MPRPINSCNTLILNGFCEVRNFKASDELWLFLALKWKIRSIIGKYRKCLHVVINCIEFSDNP